MKLRLVPQLQAFLKKFRFNISQTKLKQFSNIYAVEYTHQINLKEVKEMKKSSFVAMILGTIGGILASLGVCMCLIPEWDAFKPGVIMGCIGVVVLLIMVFVWRKMTKKDPLRMSGKTLGALILGIIGALLLGVGMCLAMMWSNMVLGIVVGIVGIILLLSLIPLVKGLK